MSKDTVRDGLVVAMEYTLHVDGKILDSADATDPLEFLAGHDNIIPGLEEEMLGMKIGESKEVVVAPEDGYGEFDEDAFMDVPRNEFPNDVPLEIGTELHLQDEDDEDGYQLARVDSVDDDFVRLNFNHPLAGMELLFNVKVIGLREPTAEELEHGHAHGKSDD